ncbi:MAG: phosphodiester glycosidase family protein, partial [Oscillospiraceae bacterium]
MKHLAQKRPEKSGAASILKVVLADLLLIGLILVTFAFFHHVRPMLEQQRDRAQAAEAEPVQATPAPTPTPEPTPEPVDDRTEWQKKFAEHFTAEPVLTDHSYTSPEVSVTIETVVTGEDDKKVTYYVADIYIASMDNFKTYTANNELSYFSTQDVLEMDAAANAIIAISGDFYSYQKTGFLMRNGELYKSDVTYCDLCVLYEDGTMETYERNRYDADEILERGACQIWNFGPALLDENGQVKDSYNVSTTVGYKNPRSAIGYYEPGHYCFVVVDGRQPGHSAGMLI